MESGHSTLTGNKIVISGISGVFPSCANVEEFRDKLFNKEDMTTDTNKHWETKNPQMPKRIGSVPSFDKFDAQFFKVPHGQALFLDGMSKKILEQAYGALFDAGVNPNKVNGTKLGVFVGTSFVDSVIINVLNSSNDSMYSASGTCKALISNRVNYWLNSNGMSYSIDATCCSSMVALEHAFQAIRSGQCDSAFVGGSNICLNSVLSLNLRCAGMVCLDGRTKCFDKHGDGYARAEAAAILFLQRASEAKRIYAEVVYVKGVYNPSLDERFLPICKPEQIENFLRAFYSETNVSPEKVKFIEASATGIAEADCSELKALGNFFGINNPIHVGCLKSNIGHSEGASDICTLVKACIAYNNGKVQPNLCNDDTLNHISALKERKVTIAVDNCTIKEEYLALNSISYSGLVYHALLKGNFKEKNAKKYVSSIPWLVLASGRTRSSVSRILKGIGNMQFDPELIALLNDFFSLNISGHTARGFAIFDKTRSLLLKSEDIDYYLGNKESVCFMYSGMGSQWLGMGTELLIIPTFAASIERCQKIMEPKGVDVINIITTTDEIVFKNILNLFVGITAIQIGLTDILKKLGIVPDYIIGHSLGELVCAYADGCLNTEETILAAYYRGLVSSKIKFINGSMAAVMLGHEEMVSIVPKGIEVVCHNSGTSSTISGPKELVQNFVAQMTDRGIFAKEVDTANIPYHSSYIREAGPLLHSMLIEVIKNPKLRSPKWLCTSAPPKYWAKRETMIASAEYFTNNLLNYVYFQEAAKFIPTRSIIIEIAPHGLMQAILKKSRKDCVNIPLTRKSSSSITFFLQAVGKMYKAGLNPKIDFLYPKIQYPVSSETPPLSQLVQWAHIEDWPVPRNSNSEEFIRMCGRQFSITNEDDDWSFIKGHIRNGANIFPESALLVLVWETVAMYNDCNYRDTSVVFENVRFERELFLTKKKYLKFALMVQKSTKRFEIHEENMQIASGFVKIVKRLKTQNKLIFFEKIDDRVLPQKDVYNIFNKKGYSYKNGFQSIRFSNMQRNKANVELGGNWVTFLDSLIQINIFAKKFEGICVPKYISKLTINTEQHKNVTDEFDDHKESCYNAFVLGDFFNKASCAGVVLENVIFHGIPTIKDVTNTLPLNIFNSNHVPIRTGDNFKLLKDTVNQNNLQTLVMERFGDLDSLTWKDKQEDQIVKNIKVAYAGITLRDCYVGTGLITGEISIFGQDFSGYNKRGAKVMGMVFGGAISSSVAADHTLLWPIPEYWDLEDAATVPLPYASAYYCLFIRSSFREYSKVFITDATDSLGQALISICLLRRCTVLASVNTIAKKIFLLSLFPQLEEKNILPSLRFDKSSLSCDYVISTSTGESRENALNYVGENGSFLDVNNYNMKTNSDMGLAYFCGNRRYVSVRVTSLFREDNVKERKIVQQMIYNGIKTGEVRPLTRLVYNPDRIIRAFRFKSSRKQYGRVLIKMEDKIARTENSVEKRKLPNGYDDKAAVFELKSDALQKIMTILGVSDDSFNSLPFDDLSATEGQLNEIRNILKTSYQNDIALEDLRKFSLKRFEEIFNVKKENNKKKNGLDAICSTVNVNAVETINPIVTMPSKVTCFDSQTENKLDSSLIMIPGFEGHDKYFSSLIDNLKLSAITLLLPLNLEDDSIPKIASNSIKHFKDYFDVEKRKFYLLGYSFGVNVALELAKLLEDEGYTGVIYCLDCSPDKLRKQISAYVDDISTRELENDVIKHMCNLLTGSCFDGLEDINLKQDWEEKVKFAVNKLKNQVALSHEFMKLVIEVFYKRLNMAKNYVPNFKLKSQIVLIKGVDQEANTGTSKIFANDLDLSKLSVNAVKIFDVNSSNDLIPFNTEVPNCINRMLDVELLDKYKTKNLCETYYLNTDKPPPSEE